MLSGSTKIIKATLVRSNSNYSRIFCNHQSVAKYDGHLGFHWALLLNVANGKSILAHHYPNPDKKPKFEQITPEQVEEFGYIEMKSIEIAKTVTLGDLIVAVGSEDYDLFTNNCQIMVSKAMKFLGYNPTLKDFFYRRHKNRTL